MDEMGSFVHDKSQPYWLWRAIDHQTKEPSAYCFGTREHKFLDELLGLLAPFSISVLYAGDNFAYKKRVKDDVVITGKRNTQKIERKHLSLRTWRACLVRNGLRFLNAILRVVSLPVWLLTNGSFGGLYLLI